MSAAAIRNTNQADADADAAALVPNLVQQRQHFLLDEPTSHLDIRYQHEFLALVRKLGVTTLVVLHDLNFVAQQCDDLIKFDYGHATATGAPDRVLEPGLIHRVCDIHADRIRSSTAFICHAPSSPNVHPPRKDHDFEQRPITDQPVLESPRPHPEHL